MRKAALISLVWLAFPGLALAADRPPVVVELFTAQGCQACGAANDFVGELADRKGVLPLTFSVDYWDYTGWSDTFAKAEFACLLATWVGRFHFELADEADRDEKNLNIKGGITARPEKGLRVYTSVIDGW